eukprot:RCo036084
MIRRPPRSSLFPTTTLFRSGGKRRQGVLGQAQPRLGKDSGRVAVARVRGKEDHRSALGALVTDADGGDFEVVLIHFFLRRSLPRLGGEEALHQVPQRPEQQGGAEVDQPHRVHKARHEPWVHQRLPVAQVGPVLAQRVGAPHDLCIDGGHQKRSNPAPHLRGVLQNLCVALHNGKHRALATGQLQHGVKIARAALWGHPKALKDCGHCPSAEAAAALVITSHLDEVLPALLQLLRQGQGAQLPWHTVVAAEMNNPGPCLPGNVVKAVDHFPHPIGLPSDVAVRGALMGAKLHEGGSVKTVWSHRAGNNSRASDHVGHLSGVATVGDHNPHVLQARAVLLHQLVAKRLECVLAPPRNGPPHGRTITSS